MKGYSGISARRYLKIPSMTGLRRVYPQSEKNQSGGYSRSKTE